MAISRRTALKMKFCCALKAKKIMEASATTVLYYQIIVVASIRPISQSEKISITGKTSQSKIDTRYQLIQHTQG